MQLAFLQTAMLQSKPHLGWLGRVPDEVAVHCRTASIARNPIACGTHAVIGFEIDLLVLDGAPQALRVSEFLCKRFGRQFAESPSPNSIVNRFRAAFQSRMGIVHLRLMLCRAK